MHRDIKPENILISNKETIKIGDFGLSREMPDINENNFDPLTEYICTRWYRAPECILKSNAYSYAIDIWAFGAVMAEMYTFEPIFPGKSEFNQLSKIIEIIGSPSITEWTEGFNLIRKIGLRFYQSNPQNLKKLIPDASDYAIDLLLKVFKWNPSDRPTCDELLNHPYFNKDSPSKLNYFDNKNILLNNVVINDYTAETNMNNNFPQYKTNLNFPNIYTKQNIDSNIIPNKEQKYPTYQDFVLGRNKPKINPNTFRNQEFKLPSIFENAYKYYK
jgi:serine/threonine protein kinase